jgi:hypothetical protein
MNINGHYIGLGIGDTGAEIQKIKAFMRKKFSYAALLSDNTVYDAALAAVVSDMQARYAASGTLKPGTYTPGVINLDTKYAMGYLTRPPAELPIFFTVEGHLSDMWAGPCAATAQALEAEGRCRWQPVGYDNVSLPFDDSSGINELDRLFSDTAAFPLARPWLASCFSQGALVFCQFFMDQVQNPNGKHHNRFATWRGTLAHGNPMREKDVNAEWVPDPPKPGTQGIYDRHMTGTGPGGVLAARWREVNRTGDLYAENSDDEAGKDRTAVCLAVVDGQLMGAGSLAERIWLLASNIGGEVWPLFQAIAGGVRFLLNMAPHGTYDLGPGIDFMRERLTEQVAA